MSTQKKYVRCFKSLFQCESVCQCDFVYLSTAFCCDPDSQTPFWQVIKENSWWIVILIFYILTSTPFPRRRAAAQVEPLQQNAIQQQPQVQNEEVNIPAPENVPTEQPLGADEIPVRENFNKEFQQNQDNCETQKQTKIKIAGEEDNLLEDDSHSPKNKKI